MFDASLELEFVDRRGLRGVRVLHGSGRLWPVQFWPIHFWPINFLCCGWCLVLFVVVVVVRVGGVVIGLDHLAPDPSLPEPPSAGPLRADSLHRTAKNFALFFPSPATNFALFLSHCAQVQSMADNMIRSARYGLRGVRVGEAKHPSFARANTSTDQPEMGVVEAFLFDLTHADSSDDVMQGTLVDGSDESSTESVVQRPRRRLTLIWHEEADVVWHRDARAAEGVVMILASRIGAVPEGEIPPPVRRQRWSPLNVPLIWSAAGHDDSTPVLDWLAGSLTGAPSLAFHDGTIDAPAQFAMGGGR